MAERSTDSDDAPVGAAVAEASGTRNIDADIGADVPPQQLIFTVFGLYSRQRDNWLSSASVVRLTTALGVEEPIARSALSRMKRRGYIEGQKRDGIAGYRLTDSSVRIIVDGEHHVYGRARAEAADGWVVVGFSVPESQRERRHKIRTALIRLGFGTVSPGMWIAPAHLGDEVRGALQQLGVTEHVDVFHADYIGFGDPADKVATWWNLDALAGMYVTFADRFGALASNAAEPVDPETAFGHYVPMLTTWRRLPYLDPGLPLSLLPDPWAGSEVEELFSRLDEAWREPARVFATSCL